MTAALELETHQREFHQQEYEQLRGEVVGLLGRIELLFRYSMVVAASVFAWLLSNSMGLVGTPASICLKLPSPLLWFGWLIPPAFVLCAGLMASVTSKRVNEIGDYLLKLEDALGHQSLGWQKHLAGEKSILTPTTKKLWWFLFALTIVATAIALFAVYAASGACPTQ
jgi:hypothetical protein